MNTTEPDTLYDIARLDYTRAIRQKILQLFKDEKTPYEIADILGLAKKTVYQHLAGMGIKLPERKRINGKYA